MARAIAIDVGGHGAKGQLVREGDQHTDDSNAVIVRYPSVIANPGIDKKDVPGHERLAAVEQIITELRRRTGGITHIGIATTGTVNPQTGIVIRDQAATYQGTNWPQQLRDRGCVELEDILYVQNDAKAGAWAEYRLWRHHPRAKDVPTPKTFIRVTVGSGVGSAIILNGIMHLGAGFVAGEFTYMPFRPSDDLAGYIPEVPCNDRRNGCTESFAASPGILRGAQQAIAARKSEWARKFADPSAVKITDVAEGYRTGDPHIRGVIQFASAALGSALLNIIYLLGPDVVLVGGGVTEIIPDYLPLVQQYVSEYGIVAPAINAAVIAGTQIPSDASAALGIAYLSFDEGRRVKDYLR